MEETTPHFQNETPPLSSTPHENVFTIEGYANLSEPNTSVNMPDIGTYLNWLSVYSSNTMSILTISRDMTVDLMRRAWNVMRYLRDDSLAVNLIKYKDYVIKSMIKRPEREEFLAEDVILVILSILAFIYNWIADIGVSFIYFRDGEHFYAIITLAIMVFPLILVNVMSMYFYRNENHECSVEPILLQQTNRCSRPVAWGLCVIMHFLLMGQVYRNIILIYVGMKSWGEERVRAQMRDEVSTAIAQQQHVPRDDSASLDSLNSVACTEIAQSEGNSASERAGHPCIDYYALYVHQEFDVAVMDLTDAFLHDGTQVILQLYLILMSKEEAHWRKVGQIQSAVMSLVSLSWCYSEYTRAKRSSSLTKIKLNFLGMIVQFLWRLCTLVSRVFAFALFATEYGYYIIFIIMGHWLLMSLWVHQQHRTASDQTPYRTNFWNVMRSCVIGYIYVFCFFNIKNEPTRFKYLIFYILVFIENQTLLFIWYFTVYEFKFALPVYLSLTGSFIVGIMFMTLYYTCIHPHGKLPNRSQPARII